MRKSENSVLLLIFLTGFILGSCNRVYYPEAEKRPFTPLLLISIDGFMPEYMDRFDTPALDFLASEGTLADYMIPVFPTKTFPNHYSIVTGLYTENSGIIANNMYDPEMDAYFSLGNRGAVMDPRWYGGEPIWVTAEKQGIPAATLFWPGSEAPVKDTYATRWMPYDGSLSHTARVDTIISWLQVPDETAPGFLTLYFSKVDTYGHRYGTKSDSVAAAVEDVDRSLGYLTDELKRIGQWDKINILITSDHGMADISGERVILLDDLISLDDVEVIDWTPVAMIRPREGKTDEVYTALKASEKDHSYRVYKKEDMPEFYRMKNHRRVPGIIMIADVGYTITSSPFLERNTIGGATHGYDHRAPEMRSFFLAAGPGIKKNRQIPPFRNIHLYELMARLLDIEPAANDGSLDSLRHIFP